LGLVLITGQVWIDALMTFLIAAHLFVEGYKVLRRSVAGLTDEMDDESLRALSSSIEKNRTSGVIDIHHVRVIRSGSFHHIDAHMVIPEFWNVSQAHEMTHRFEEKVVEDYPFDAEFAFHLDPCLQKYCAFCDVRDCPIRIEPFRKAKKFSFQHLIAGPDTPK